MLTSALSDPAFPFSLPASHKSDKSLPKMFYCRCVRVKINEHKQTYVLEERTPIRGKVASAVDKVSKKLSKSLRRRPFFSSFFLSSGAAAASALTPQEWKNVSRGEIMQKPMRQVQVYFGTTDSSKMLLKSLTLKLMGAKLKRPNLCFFWHPSVEPWPYTHPVCEPFWIRSGAGL